MAKEFSATLPDKTMKRVNILLRIAGVLMVAIGIIQAINGFQLYQSGSSFIHDKAVISGPESLSTAVIGIFTAAILLFFCGLGVLFNRKFFWNLSFFALIIYITVELVNGMMLFNELFKIEFSIHLTFATLIAVLLYLGRKEL